MTHAEINQLIPWYVNGTLERAQEAAIRDETASCRDCAAEVAFVERLMLGLPELDPLPPASVFDAVLSRTGSSPVKKTPGRFGAQPRQLLPGRFAGAIASAAFIVLIGGSALVSMLPRAHLNFTDGGSRPENLATEAVMRPVAVQHLAVPKAPPGAGVAGSAAAPAGPALVRTGSMSLIVNDVDAALRDINRIASARGGSVRSLSDGGNDAATLLRAAHVEIAVPKDTFEASMEDVAKLGKVESRSIAAEDVSDQLVDGAARLRNLRREEHDLSAIMDRSGKVSDILEVQQQLADVRDQIERLDAELRNKQSSVAFSALSIDLSSERVQAVIARGPLAKIADAWQNAWRAAGELLIFLASTFIWLLAFSPYFAGIALAGYLIYRWNRRRSR